MKKLRLKVEWMRSMIMERVYRKQEYRLCIYLLTAICIVLYCLTCKSADYVKAEGKNLISATAKSGKDVMVEDGEQATLEVVAQADDLSQLSFQWYHEEYNETDKHYEFIAITEAKEAVYETDAITQQEYYRCIVQDQYGNSQEVDFAIDVSNDLQVTAGDEGSYITVVKVAPYAQAQLHVNVSAKHTDGLKYEWYFYPTIGGVSYKVASGVGIDTYTTDSITQRTQYYCIVEDKYGHKDTAYFYIRVDNDLSAKPIDDREKYVTSGSNVTLQVAIEAVNTNGMSYQWYQYNDSTYDDSNRTAVGENQNTYLVKEIQESTYYRCVVRDQYGNTDNVLFGVHVHALSKQDAVAPACTTAGNIEYYSCSGCSKCYVDNNAETELTQSQIVIPALGHSWGEWVILKEATDTEPGECERICQRDASHVEKQTIPQKQTASGHVDNGTDKGVDWVLDSDGKLTVTGTGNFKEKGSVYPAWYESRGGIRSAVVNLTGTTDASYMFYRCYFLEEVDVKNFDTKEVTNMSNMFQYCFALKNLDLSSFDTASVTNMQEMLSGCNSLSSIDVSRFELIRTSNMDYMMGGMTDLKKIKVFKNLPQRRLDTLNLPVSPMYDAEGNEYTTFPINLSVGIWLYADKELIEETPKEYALIYDENGGYGLRVTSKTLVENEPYGTLPVPERSDFIFIGWYTAEDGGEAVTENTVCKGDAVIYAHWKLDESKASSKVWLHVKKGEGSGTYSVGGMVQIFGNVYEDYMAEDIALYGDLEFAFWWIEKGKVRFGGEANELGWASEVWFQEPGDVVLRALYRNENLKNGWYGSGEWSNRKYQFYLDNEMFTGWHEINNDMYYFFEDGILATSTWIGDRYVDSGGIWRQDKTAGDEQEDEPKPIVDGITVTFESNGGSSVELKVVEKGEPFTKPEDPTKQGYTFVGWYADDTLLLPWNFADYVSYQDIILYAKWQKKSDTDNTDSEFASDQEIHRIFVLKQKQDITAFFTAATPYKKYTVTPKGAATVTSKGILTAKKPAETLTVTGLVKDGKQWKEAESVTFKIEKPAITAKTITATRAGITIDAATNISGTTLQPSSWLSSKPAVAEIDAKTGLITTKTKGTAKITAVYGEGKNAAKYTFNVKVSIPVMSKTKATLLTGGILQLKLRNMPKTGAGTGGAGTSGMAESTVLWSSSDAKSVTVDDTGKVTVFSYNGKTAGKATITATYDGVSYSCEIEVKKPELKKTSLTMKQGKAQKLTFKNTKLKNAKWTSLNEKVATVDDTGRVTGVSSGTAVIQAVVGGVTVKCEVKVE